MYYSLHNTVDKSIDFGINCPIETVILSAGTQSNRQKTGARAV